MKNEILVIGGTGNTGAPLVDLLQESDQSYRVLVRNDQSEARLAARGIPTLRGALGDWPGIEAALADVDTLFLVSSPAPEMLELHKRVIDLAVSTGVRKIVRLSAEPARASKGMALYEQHAEADEYLMASSIAYVILRPHYFMQNIPQMHAAFMQDQKMFAQYLGETRIPMVDTRDIALAAYLCLTSDDFNNRIHYITGPDTISFYDVATSFSKALDQQISYVSLSYEDQKAGLSAAGLPDWTIDTVMTLFKRWVDVGEHPVSPDFEQITGVKAISIDQFAADFAPSM
ncbi:NmrA family NAD(P)-binding protein [Candidatus Halocynthiibacter alkanivorans]|uniref:NmrA family NAD(P)-binding protein n=1 Tax=Candidatus Halocynthiibacter alkanivorans TaxID=2267619 RepID=UPI001357CE8B|nr:NmrA family NAD(P)-binding protein [Candidatus Halocynthiibacter alkanivorans]